MSAIDPGGELDPMAPLERTVAPRTHLHDRGADVVLETLAGSHGIVQEHLPALQALVGAARAA